MTAVLKHELKNYFRSMTAYIFGAGLLLAVGLGAMGGLLLILVLW